MTLPTSSAPAALAGLRVLDLTGPMGNYAGKLFGDMGADVILVEPPGGTALRREPPFIGQIAGAERSLNYAYQNTSKRGICLDLDTPSGQRILRELAAGCDLILESQPPGWLAARGLGYAVLARDHPALVLASITPFGQTGPYAQLPATDLVGLATGGLLWMGGYQDAAPTQAHGDQAFKCAAMYGAVAALLAVDEAERTGRGQQVDVAMQECVTLALENAAQFYELEGTIRKRPLGGQYSAAYGLFDCKDGYIFLGSRGIGTSEAWPRTLQWLKDENMEGVERLFQPEWSDGDYLRGNEAKEVFGDIFMRWARKYTMDWLYREGQRRMIPIAPVCMPVDLIDNPQLQSRGHFVPFRHPLLERAAAAPEPRMPGAPYVLSATPWRIQRRAPLLGEHTAEVLGEIGIAADDVARLHAAGVVLCHGDAGAAGGGHTATAASASASATATATAPAPAAAIPSSAATRTRRPRTATATTTPTDLPLAGLRVADFCWIGAGSYTTKIFGDLGADVIKIETATRMDSLRLAPPYKDGRAGINRSGYFADRNTSKRGITIDLKHPDALPVIRRLITRSDIIANNFAAGVMEKFGLGYADCARLRPDAIYLAMSAQGAKGPESAFRGTGASIAALTGIQALSGLPGRLPAGTGTNYPDHLPNPCHAAFAVLAALRHRRATGQGQYIDFAQTEPMLCLIGPTFLDLTVNAQQQQRRGNDHPWAAPHGVYPARGDDRWIALSVMDDAQWAALVELMGRPAWALQPQWQTLPERWHARAALDAQLAGWTAGHAAQDLMDRLMRAGVPAGVVHDAHGVVRLDPQLAHRGHWVRLPHPEMGESLYNNLPFRFSRTPVRPRRAAPLLGEHTREVLRDLLGYAEAEIDALEAAEVLR